MLHSVRIAILLIACGARSAHAFIIDFVAEFDRLAASDPLFGTLVSDAESVGTVSGRIDASGSNVIDSDGVLSRHTPTTITLDQFSLTGLRPSSFLEIANGTEDSVSEGDTSTFNFTVSDFPGLYEGVGFAFTDTLANALTAAEIPDLLSLSDWTSAEFTVFAAEWDGIAVTQSRVAVFNIVSLTPANAVAIPVSTTLLLLSSGWFPLALLQQLGRRSMA